MTKNIKKNVNKIYPKKFKQEAIKLDLESPSITGTAKSLGIPEATFILGYVMLKIADNN